MKIAITSKEATEPVLHEFEITEEDQYWHCEKCQVLYGKGEKILTDDRKNFLCPEHKTMITYATREYWEKNFNLKK